MVRAGTLLLVALLLLEACLLGGERVVGTDTQAFGDPLREMIGERLAAGELPRWNPLAFHGVSLFGPRTSGVLYPPNWLAALAPARVAFALLIAFHLLVGCLGARRLARPGCSSGAAWAAGLTYGLGGFAVSMYWGPYLTSAAWLPWVLVGARLWDDAPRRGAAVAGGALGAILLAGELQGALTAAFALGLALLVLQRRARSVRGAVWVGGAVLGAAALAAPVVVSALLELPRVGRGLPGWNAALFAFEPSAPGLILDLIASGAGGAWAAPSRGYWVAHLWNGEPPWCGLGIGSLGLAAAAAGLYRWRTPTAQLGLLLVGAGVVLAFSGVSELVALRFPCKWLVLSALGLSLLVGVGWDALIRGGDGAPAGRLVLGGLAFLAGVGALWLLVGGESAAASLTGGSPRGVVDGTAARSALLVALLRTAFAAGCAYGVLRLLSRGRLSPRLGVALLLGLLTGELWLAAKLTVRTHPGASSEPPWLEPLRADGARPPGAPLRVETQTVASQVQLLGASEGDLSPYGVYLRDRERWALPNTGARYGLRSVDAFASVAPRAYTLVLTDPRARALPVARRAALIDADAFLIRAADLARLPRPHGLVVLWEGHGVVLVRNPACPPWAYVAASAAPADSLDGARALVLDPEAPPFGERVVLGPERYAESAGRGAGRVLEIEHTPERVQLEVELERPGWLVVRDSYSPDWSATVDGQPVDVARADLLYRAVFVPAGRHVVAFEHAPSWWAPSLLLALLGAAGLAALGWREPTKKAA